MATETLYGIQFLRFLAAGMVVVRHAAGRTDVVFPHQGFSEWTLGSTGVDIFFVISGFLMVRVTEGRNADPLRFWLRRLIRIVPLYWACTIATFLLVCLFPLYFFTVPSIKDVAMSLLFLPEPLPNGRIEPIIPPGWTLNLEMPFYLLIAISLMFKRSAMVIAISALFVLFLIAVATKNTGYFANFYANSVWLDFALGALLGYLIKPGDAPKPLVGLLLVVTGIALLALSRFSGGERMFVWGFPAFMIVAGFIMAEPIFRKPYFGFFILIGDASYALYLVHSTWMAPLMWIGLRHRDGIIAGLPPTLFFLLLLTGSLAIGLLVHVFFEKPVIALLKKRLAL